MSVDVQETQEKRQATKDVKPGNGTEPLPPVVKSRPSLIQRVRGIRWETIQWRDILLTALVMAVGWCVLFTATGWIQFLAGIVPVSAGLFLGRRVKQHVLLQGLLLGINGFLIGLFLVVVYGLLGSAGLVPMPELMIDPNSTTPVISSFPDLIMFYISFSLFAMIPFPAFGTVIAYRNEQRRQEMDAELARRGGQLERPGAIRTLEDIQGLSLPQFGTYVRNLFVKQGFTFKDYRFLDKDKHLDLFLEYQNELYQLRLSVADKVRSGTIEMLVQDMRQSGAVKGIVITSTEFTNDVQKSAKGRKNILLIDGETLFGMAEG